MGPQIQYAAPPTGGQPTYTISPERFQLILQGQPLTNEEIDAMTGAPQATPVMTMTQGAQSMVGGSQAEFNAAPAAIAAPATDGVALPAAEVAATTSAKKGDKKKSDKKKA